jgi:surfeit locus 1 family protein
MERFLLYITTPFKRRWIFSTITVAIISLIMVGLGSWQLGRHNERMAYINAVAAEVEEAPFVLTGTPEDDAYADRVYHQVVADGHFDFGQQVLIQNKFYKDVMGFHVVTPFLIEGSDRAVLVDRGWIPPGQYQSPADLTQFDEPDVTSIHGIIVETAESKQPPESPQFLWYRVDVASIARQLPYPVLPFYVALSIPETPRTEPPYPDPPELELDPGSHFGYAVEWFFFALALPLFYAWQVVRLDRREQEGDE